MSAEFWRPLRELTYDDVESLRTAGDREKAILDYKRFAKNFAIDGEALATDFVAFANSGGGRIVFGAVEENERLKEFSGVPAEKLRMVSMSIRNTAHRVQPPVDIDVRDVDLPAGGYIVVVEIVPGQLGPFQFQGKYGQRAGSGNVPMPHTNVVNAVMATSGRKGDGPGNSPFGAFSLAKSPFSSLPTYWCLGVQLRPAYSVARPIYDPLSKSVKSIEEWLHGHGYKPEDVKRRLTALYATHNTGWLLELSQYGWTTAIDSSDPKSDPVQLEAIRLGSERMIRDCAACLDAIEPFFNVFVSLKFWGPANANIGLQWAEGRSRQVTTLPLRFDAPQIGVDRPYRVRDLIAEDAQREVADRFCESLKLFVQP